jgi:hypothetical protein
VICDRVIVTWERLIMRGGTPSAGAVVKLWGPVGTRDAGLRRARGCRPPADSGLETTIELDFVSTPMNRLRVGRRSAQDPPKW